MQIIYGVIILWSDNCLIGTNVDLAKANILVYVYSIYVYIYIGTYVFYREKKLALTYIYCMMLNWAPLPSKWSNNSNSWWNYEYTALKWFATLETWREKDNFELRYISNCLELSQTSFGSASLLRNGQDHYQKRGRASSFTITSDFEKKLLQKWFLYSFHHSKSNQLKQIY